MKKLLWLALLLPMFVNAQTPGTLQRLPDGTLRGAFGSLGVALIPSVSINGTDGYILIYDSATKKYVPTAYTPVIPGLPDSLANKADKNFANVSVATVRSKNGISATSPIFYNSGTGVISSQPASATDAGYLTTGTQTIAGAKTWTGYTQFTGLVYSTGTVGSAISGAVTTGSGVQGQASGNGSGGSFSSGTGVGVLVSGGGAGVYSWNNSATRAALEVRNSGAGNVVDIQNSSGSTKIYVTSAGKLTSTEDVTLVGNTTSINGTNFILGASTTEISGTVNYRTTPRFIRPTSGSAGGFIDFSTGNPSPVLDWRVGLESGNSNWVVQNATGSVNAISVNSSTNAVTFAAAGLFGGNISATATTGYATYSTNSGAGAIGVYARSTGTGGKGLFAEGGDGYAVQAYNNSTSYVSLDVKNSGAGSLAQFSNTGGSVATITNSGGLNLSGALTGTTSTMSGNISTTGGSVYVGGSSGFQGKINYDATTGLQIQGKTGSAYDFSLYSPGGSELITNATGTTGIKIWGALSGASATFTNPANTYTRINGNSTTGQSFGLRIDAGTNSSDYAIRILNQSASTDYFSVKGDGAATFGGVITSTVATNAFILNTGASTSAKYINIQNTSGGAIIGTEGSAGGFLIVGNPAYYGAVTGRAGLSFSANDGATLHYRMNTSGNNFWTGEGSFAGTIYAENALLRVGKQTPTANGTALLQIGNSNSVANWQISTNNNFAGALEWSKSTSGGSYLFSTTYGMFTTGGFFKASNDGTYFGSSNPYHELRSSTTSNYTLIVSNTAASPYGIHTRFSTGTNNASNTFFEGNDGGTDRFAVYTNGGIANYSANNVNLSDSRAKKNITKAGSYWEVIKAIEFDSYKYKDQKDSRTLLGVMAQQVESVYPAWVSNSGSFGKAADGTNLKSVYEQQLQYGVNIVVQESMKRIEALEAEIVKLKNK